MTTGRINQVAIVKVRRANQVFCPVLDEENRSYNSCTIGVMSIGRERVEDGRRHGPPTVNLMPSTTQTPLCRPVEREPPGTMLRVTPAWVSISDRNRQDVHHGR